jgi:hypothetical protein
MITVDKKQGIAQDVAELWRGTKNEPAEEGIPVVVGMSIDEDIETISFSWTEGPHRADNSLVVPVGRLKELLDEI